MGPLHSQYHNAPAGKSNFISVPQQNTLVICNQALQFRPCPGERSAAHTGGGFRGDRPRELPRQRSPSGGSGARSTREPPEGSGAAQEKQQHGPRAPPSPILNTILSKARPKHGCSVFPAVFQLCSHSHCLLQFQTPLSLLPSPPPQQRYTITYILYNSFF